MQSYKRLLFAVLTAGLTLSVSAQTVSRSDDGYEVTVEHQFSIDRSDAILEVDAYLGSIDLIGTRSSVTTITETFIVEAESEREAREMAANIASMIEQSGRRIEIHNTWGDGEDRELKIEMEAGMRAFVSTLAGDIEAGGGSGDMRLATGAGSVTVVGVSGSVDATSGAGDMEMERISGEVTVKLGAGDV